MEALSPSELFEANLTAYTNSLNALKTNVDLTRDTTYDSSVGQFVTNQNAQSELLQNHKTKIQTFCSSTDPANYLTANFTKNSGFSYCPNAITRLKGPLVIPYTSNAENISAPYPYNKMEVTLVGGGGAGGGGGARYTHTKKQKSNTGGGGGGGGGSGYVTAPSTITIQPETKYSLTVGTGGIPTQGDRYTHNRWDDKGGWKFASHPFTDNGTPVRGNAPEGTASTITIVEKNGTQRFYRAEGGKGGGIGKHQIAGEGEGFHNKTKEGDGGPGGDGRNKGADGGNGKGDKSNGTNFGNGGAGYDTANYGKGGNGGAGSWPNTSNEGGHDTNNGRLGESGSNGVVIVKLLYDQSLDSNVY